MPHIHEAIDWTVVGYVVHDQKVLMVEHKKLNRWLPPGGHVELDQDPEEALFNELAEETGLKPDNLTLFGNKPTIESPGTKFLHAPTFQDIHVISDTHRHIVQVYILESDTDQIELAEREHTRIRWFTAEDLNSSEYNLLPSVRFYGQEALRIVGTSNQ